ncbi:MAG: hypothetical protein AAB261_07480 [Chloroflexota bacterium]
MSKGQRVSISLILIGGILALGLLLKWGFEINSRASFTPTPLSISNVLTQRAVGVTVVALSPVTVTSLPNLPIVTLQFTAVIAPPSLPTATPPITPQPPTQVKPPTPTSAATQAAATSTSAKWNRGAPPIIGPSPTWSVSSFPTRAPASGGTKIGFHATLRGELTLDYVAKVKPPVMKGVDDIQFLKKVKAVSPNTITIGRYVVPQLNIGEGDAAKRAIDFVNEYLPKYREHKDYVDYWEGWNEVAFPNYEWYAVFEATRACEMQKHGFKASIGNFSSGTPEPWQFEAFLPAIEAGIRCNAILGLHEYGAPTMYLWWAQGLPASMGHAAVAAYPDRGPLIGRYRYFYRDYLIPRNKVIPLVISETGIDGLVAMGQRPGYSNDEGPGWRGFATYWSKELKKDDAAAFYAEQLAWYDSLLRQDEYVLGATIFNVAGGTNAQFTSYEPGGALMTKLTEYALTLK